MEDMRNRALACNISVEIMRHSSVLLPGHRMIRINRVPHHVRSAHQQAYTPRVVSIGPLHHFDEKLQNMGKQKLAYLESFLRRVNKELVMLVVAIRDKEESIRRCYRETSLDSMESDDFVKMILLDAIFILELFSRYSGRWGGDESDPLQINQWTFSFVTIDLLLFENQLPFPVLELLFNVAFDNVPNPPNLITLTFMFFSYYNVHCMPPENVIIEHFTGLIRAFLVKPLPLGNLGKRMMVKHWYSATALRDAGVKFEKGGKLEFEKYGVLTMPSVVLDDQMEAAVRNVMALEHFCRGDDGYVMDYFIFLGFFVNTIEDINLLCERGILINKLVDSKAALSMVKNLVTHVADSRVSPNIYGICQSLSGFYNMRFQRWKAKLSATTLKNQYFSDPFRGAATFAACLLLLLSLIQTIMSVLQVARA